MVREKILIIGIGSPFENDRLGWLAVEWLEGKLLPRDLSHHELGFALSDRPGALLLQQLHDCDAAIIIDAMQSGLPEGSVRQFSAEQLSCDTGLLSSHGLGVAEAISLGIALSKATGNISLLPNRVSIIGIETGTDEIDESWQPQLLTLLQQILSGWTQNSWCDD